MTKHSRLLFPLTLFILWALSCTRPVLIGSDFLEDEKADLLFRDDFDLSFFTEKTDSVIVHSNNLSLQLLTYLCGNIDDPVFGRYSAEIYAQPTLVTVASVLRDATPDSIVLQLRYDTLGTYGNTEDPVTLEVYRMTENPESNTNWYSSQRFMTSAELLGSVTLVPRPKDSISLYRPNDTVRLAPHIRIPLDLTALADFTLQDSAVYTNEKSFLDYFSGLHIRMTSGTNTMLGFNLFNSISGLSVYYDKGEVMDQEFKFVFTTGSVKMVHMEHDYTGSLVEAALAEGPEDEYWFVQGMSGVTTRMEIAGLEALGNVQINRAELEFYGTFPDGDVQAFYRPCTYLVTQEKTDTLFVFSPDVATALNAVSGNPSVSLYHFLFGGQAGEPDQGPPVVYRFSMKVTNQLREIFRGQKENAIYFNPFGKADVPNRSVIFGPGHPQYAPRLRVHYTAL